MATPSPYGTDNTQVPCPRCRGPLGDFPEDIGGGSRVAVERDVRICGRCATDEAVRDALGRAPLPYGEWPLRDDHLTWADVPKVPGF
ncbi:hypothetical protein ABZ851_37120 [Streptomyces sp. NPDC047049]|uniref:hypothetical protein n=1 Tax=Streptomyces sp. NPDC047049 TaxID=3156688 RepID=UPI00340A0E7F